MKAEKQQRRAAHQKRMQEAQASKLRRAAAKLLAVSKPVFVPRPDSALPVFQLADVQKSVQAARAELALLPPQMVVATMTSEREAAQALKNLVFAVGASLVGDYDAAAYFLKCGHQLAANSVLLLQTGWPATDKYMAQVRASLEAKGYPQGHRSV